MVKPPKNVSCFNACYSTNNQSKAQNYKRNLSPFSSMSCTDKGNLAFSDGDVHNKEFNEFNTD